MTAIPYVDRDELVQLLLELGVDGDPVRRALGLARESHAGQLRSGGGPYLEEHVYPVTASVASYLARVDSDELETATVVALLHDTIEDCPEVTRESIAAGFGERVGDWVWALTKPAKVHGEKPGDPARERAYLEKVRAAPHPVQVVKVMDRLNNLAGVDRRSNEERRAYLDESRRFYVDLAREVDPALASRMMALIAEQEQSERTSDGA